ncbi:hypothetical protein [Bradyrhizobium sp. AUGA SZCCT0160]|uniref:hypothetical protein n=1 Tax=Bradyrhizobium sp. AUGA SZCCT0160 TaxID=2807662 RepID=UPI001BACC7A9|nr:hypothetical protein [Bradyrhizobium sp. AUGA SZCCT0160]MBR1193208.1 hypothetical protein [Bradyrhizobium sp. AUGA SZCCT0160]
MNKHVASETVVPFRRPLEAVPRWEIVKVMSEYLIAAILHDGLDTSSDIDVIECLLSTPERFQSRVVLNHLDDALYEAKQQLIARELGDA